jgi:hypothetical protein
MESAKKIRESEMKEKEIDMEGGTEMKIISKKQ